MSPSNSAPPTYLADQLADLDDPTPRGMYDLDSLSPCNSIDLTDEDFDPEDLDHDEGTDDENNTTKDDHSKREHYQAVGLVVFPGLPGFH